MKLEESNFKRLLESSGYSPKATDRLWEWFDPSEKKGVASF